MYITYLRPPQCRQISFDEILAGVQNVAQLKYGDRSGTRTVQCDHLPVKLEHITDVDKMVSDLKAFNEMYAELAAGDRHSHYRTFHIPKKTGGLREINAPDDDLMNALRTLQVVMKNMMIADHHTSAFAYVEGRSTVDAVKRHQANDSHWFVKFDFHGFFPSTTTDFIISQFRQIYPFALILQRADGEQELRKALDLCMLDGGLPQGTPISPFITNVMMIPFDHKMMNALNKFQIGDEADKTDRLIYTRYADDICVSCHVTFNWHKVQQFIVDTLHDMNAPFYLNEQKTHYGSRSGKNWILGVMLNKDNDITIGHKNMKYFKATVTNYLLDKKNGRAWPLEDVQKFAGNISYYRMIESEAIDRIITAYNAKFEMDLMASIKEDLGPENQAG